MSPTFCTLGNITWHEPSQMRVWFRFQKWIHWNIGLNSIFGWRRQWQPSTLAWKIPWMEEPGRQSHGWRSLAVHGVARSRTRLRDFTFTFHFHALEKEMATHSSVLAWRIPGMAEPGGLPSMVSHRVRHDWSDLAAEAAVYLVIQYWIYICLQIY